MARKFGEGSLKAAARLGLKEVGKALQPLPDSIQPIEEPGAVGNPTTYDVSKQTGALEANQPLKSQLKGSVHGKSEDSKSKTMDREAAFEPEMEP